MLESILNDLAEEEPGAKRVRPLPYPYVRAHFKADFGEGKYRLFFLGENTARACLGRWRNILPPNPRTLPDMPALRAYTVYITANGASDPEALTDLSAQEIRLVRLLLGTSAAERGEAAALLNRLYANGSSKAFIIPCALRLSSTAQNK